MTKDQQPSGAPDEGAPKGSQPEGASADGSWLAAEGPDVETSLTDADQAFLDGAGDMPAEGAAEPEDEHLAASPPSTPTTAGAPSGSAT